MTRCRKRSEQMTAGRWGTSAAEPGDPWMLMIGFDVQARIGSHLKLQNASAHPSPGLCLARGPVSVTALPLTHG